MKNLFIARPRKRLQSTLRRHLLLCVAAIFVGQAPPASARDDAAFQSALEVPAVQKQALQLARHALLLWFASGRIMAAPTKLSPVLKQRCGVIATIEKRGQIQPRGCRGTLAPARLDLATEIIHNIISAATRDERVAKLRREELNQCRISLTIILATPAIASLSGHDASRNGLIAQRGDQIGLVLPFEGHDSVTQLRWAKRKANLRDDAAVSLREVIAVRFRED